VRISLFRRAVSMASAAVLTVLGLGIAGASPAHAASGFNLCNTDGTNLCLNDWGGVDAWGAPVLMYPGGNTNEDFELVRVDRCGNGVVNASCPFANHAFDSYYQGSVIAQIVYLPSVASGANLCVAADFSDPPFSTPSDTMLGHCNAQSSGMGGDAGTVFIFHGNTSTETGYLISLYFTNQDNNKECMFASNQVGVSPSLDLPTGAGCTLWQNRFLG
jgi:hypothetical protein